MSRRTRLRAQDPAGLAAQIRQATGTRRVFEVADGPLSYSFPDVDAALAQVRAGLLAGRTVSAWTRVAGDGR